MVSAKVNNEGETQEGHTKLMGFMHKYAKKFAEKKEMDFISVGVIGMSNVGKSSLINTLRGKPLCASSSTPFTTRAI